MIAARELYNWDVHKMGNTRFDEEGFPGCWTTPGVGSDTDIGLNDNFITAAGKIKKWDMTKKLVCKHLIDEAVPPQVKSRLVNGTTGQPSVGNKGLLQVWSLDWNYWVGLTSDHNSVAVANLACVEMGYSGVESLRGNQLTPNKWQDMIDEVLIEDFNCTGSESSLFQCDYVKGLGSFEHAIEVTCSNPTRETTFYPTMAPTLNPIANPTADTTAKCKNFGREVDGVCECTLNFRGETCETRRKYYGWTGRPGWQWFVIWTKGDTCADRGYYPIRNSIECMIAARELYNWDITKVAMTQFDKEGLPGCWTTPGVGSIANKKTLSALVEIKGWDMTKKLVCKHLIDEAVPPQIKSRLVNGTTGQPSAGNKGLLQVWSLDWNYWVGDTSDQNSDAVANLACLEMGYSGVGSLKGNQWTPNKWQDMVNEILINDFNCTGSETSLFQCDYVKGLGTPNHAIEVTCSNPTSDTTFNPTTPTMNPTKNPTIDQTANPITNNPTMTPTATPTNNPTTNPTLAPTMSPTANPTVAPTMNPTKNPTMAPTMSPTKNPTVPRTTHVGTGINSCKWEHQIREFTSFVPKEECAFACAENAECKAFYTFVKNPFSRNPLCVGFSQACTRKFSSPCPDNAWCGYNVIPQRFDFELRGRIGDELVIITDGEDKQTITLSPHFKAFSATNENIVITFKNGDNGRQYVFFKSTVHTNIRHDGRSSGWRCGTSYENVRCEIVRDGSFRYSGDYQITFDRTESDRRKLKTHRF
jgi:hypothetical protein